MGMGGQRHAPVALPPRKTRRHFYMKLGWPQGRSGRDGMGKLRPVQPAGCRYYDRATPAHTKDCIRGYN